MILTWHFLCWIECFVAEVTLGIPISGSTLKEKKIKERIRKVKKDIQGGRNVHEASPTTYKVKLFKEYNYWFELVHWFIKIKMKKIKKVTKLNTLARGEDIRGSNMHSLKMVDVQLKDQEGYGSFQSQFRKWKGQCVIRKCGVILLVKIGHQIVNGPHMGLMLYPVMLWIVTWIKGPLGIFNFF